MTMQAEHAAEAELALLAAAISGGTALEDLSAQVQPDDFRSPGHQCVWRAMQQMRGADAGVTPITVGAHLRALGLADGVESLEAASRASWRVEDLPGCVRVVVAAGKRRRLARALVELTNGIPVEPDAIHEYAHAAMERIRSVSESGIEAAPWGEPIEAVGQLVRNFRDAVDGVEVPGVSPRIRALDVRWRPGQQIVVAARPSVGKSMFAGSVAVDHAVSGGAVLILSYEMSELELRERVIARQSGLGMNGIGGKRKLAEGDQHRFIAAAEKQITMPLRIVDQPQTVEDVGLIVRRWKRDPCGPGEGVGLVIVDYLQIMPSRRRWSNRQEEVSAGSVALKRLARETGVVVMTLSQLNRESERRSDPKPVLSDLRESGAIEQDADQVLALHRSRDVDGNLEADGMVRVLKNRNGPTGDVLVRFDAIKQEVTDRPF